MRNIHEDLAHVVRLRLQVCQLYQGQDDPEVRQAIDAANQALGSLTALLYNRIYADQQPVSAPEKTP
jgi:hypothetical protein